MMIKCERCSAEVEMEFNQQANAEVRLQEVNMDFGIVTFLCYECRKSWNRFSTTHGLFKQYIEAGFVLSCWKARWRRKPGEMTEAAEGVKLLNAIQDLTQDLYQLTMKWINNGPTVEERRRAGMADEDDE